jgi:hypothetical protein
LSFAVLIETLDILLWIEQDDDFLIIFGDFFPLPIAQCEGHVGQLGVKVKARIGNYLMQVTELGPKAREQIEGYRPR